MFSDVIVLDDRPTRGGGLPDFSHAVIARLISSLESNPNASVVYLIGDQANGKNTVSELRQFDSKSIDIDRVSNKTMMPHSSIRNVADRIAGNIVFCSGEADISSDLANRLRLARDLKYKQFVNNESSKIFLNRNLKDLEFSLRREDGCRLHTASEAYPTVLEIARTSVGIPLITDQAGQELRELDDFKVYLENPTKDRIPEFLHDETEQLNNYFQKTFLDEESLFGKPLQRDKQLECVLRHVKNILTERNRFATRRAILVVPHDVKEGSDISPLGLVSVRILPRFENDRAILHYSFTWRTVEVLVGFPYSLYGSICFGEYLTDKVKSMCGPALENGVKMGSLSYVAHSLHMFVDGYGQNIARWIVNSATK
ncbi:thymidylate synthase family protein [Fundidesulfovibrio putealis]|uniref:hypothetical protein n=1 Tax=Fundidesulfovibrio putealis TaxID=270496 RepID=UPI0012EB3F42|nr:hypothetical protein [Fundidesulfovibrio putealis]